MPENDQNGSAKTKDHQDETVEPQKPSDNVSHILEEVRIILPGVQTLFGFQLIVVFNTLFHDRLTSSERYTHLVAMALTAIAAALLTAPAIYHRLAEPEQVSTQFVRVATRLISLSTLPLAVSLCLDFYLSASLVTTSAWTSILLAAFLFVVFTSLWYLLPHRASRRLSGS